MTETFQVTRQQAEAYEQFFVPALFGQWAQPMVDIAQLAPGQRVLDVACGTGIAARAAAERVGPTGAVAGVDLNPAMLEVAAQVAPAIEWRRGDAASLPFAAGSFDAVLCQSALFFFPDVAAAISEMVRVLHAGAMLAIQVYAAVSDQPGFSVLQDVVGRAAPPEALQLIQTYWSQGDLPALGAELERCGVEVVETRTILGTARYASLEELIDIEVRGTPLVDRLTEGQIQQIQSESGARLVRYRTLEGVLEMPIRAHFVAGRKR